MQTSCAEKTYKTTLAILLSQLKASSRTVAQSLTTPHWTVYRNWHVITSKVSPLFFRDRPVARLLGTFCLHITRKVFLMAYPYNAEVVNQSHSTLALLLKL